MGGNLTTNYAMPWALVYRAGDTPGKRRSTRMAFITKAHATNGDITHYVGYVMNTDMTGWSKSKRRIEPHDIIKTWRSQPSLETVRKAKKRVPIAADHYAERSERIKRTVLCFEGEEYELKPARAPRKYKSSPQQAYRDYVESVATEPGARS